jgi:hypothetical protein
MAATDTDTLPSIPPRPSWLVKSNEVARAAAPPPYVLTRPTSTSARAAATAAQQRRALKLQDAMRALAIAEHDARREVLLEWSRALDRVVRDPRRLKASGYLMFALGDQELAESRGRALLCDTWAAAVHDLRTHFLHERRLVKGVGPMMRFLQSWARGHIARKRRRELAVARLVGREARLRWDEWTDHTRCVDALQRQFLEAVQHRRRALLETDQLRVAVGLQLTALCVEEMARRQHVVSRLAAMDVSLTELLLRRKLQAQERRVRVAVLASLPTSVAAVQLEADHARSAVIAEEILSRDALQTLLLRLIVLAQRQDVGNAAEDAFRGLLRDATLETDRAYQRLRLLRRTEAQGRIARAYRSHSSRLELGRRRLVSGAAVIQRTEGQQRAAIVDAAFASGLALVVHHEQLTRCWMEEQCILLRLTTTIAFEALLRGNMISVRGAFIAAASGEFELDLEVDARRRAALAAEAAAMLSLLPEGEWLSRNRHRNHCGAGNRGSFPARARIPSSPLPRVPSACRLGGMGRRREPQGPRLCAAAEGDLRGRLEAVCAADTAAALLAEQRAALHMHECAGRAAIADSEADASGRLLGWHEDQTSPDIIRQRAVVTGRQRLVTLLREEVADRAALGQVEAAERTALLPALAIIPWHVHTKRNVQTYR